MKVGVMYGNPETTSGGMAVPFYSSIRIKLRKKEDIKKGENVYAIAVAAKIIKNKLGVPFKTCEYTITLGEGIDTYGGIVDGAVHYEIVSQKGAWFYYKDKTFQGKKAVVDFIVDNSAEKYEMYEAVMKHLNPETLIIAEKNKNIKETKKRVPKSKGKKEVEEEIPDDEEIEENNISIPDSNEEDYVDD
jgi:hypothetical protein